MQYLRSMQLISRAQLNAAQPLVQRCTPQYILQLQTRRKSSQSYKCVVVGGGSGGSTMASKMVRKLGSGNVAVIEPSETHYYQPLFTLVGSGHKTLDETRKPMAQVLPKGANWIKDSVSTFKPEENVVITSNGMEVNYDMLICSLGVQLDFSKIAGAEDALENDPAVCSVYSPKYVRKTHEAFTKFPKDGTAIFTMPPMPIKCPGAPQKIMYLFDDYLRRENKRDGCKIYYNSNLEVIFAVKKYANQLLKVVDSRDMTVNFKHNLVSVDHTTNTAEFALVGSNPAETVKFNYDLLHISPAQSTPACVRETGAPFVNEGGFVNVDPGTLQHVHYKNVFAIGDCSSCPTSKTVAAISSENGVLGRTIDDYLAGKDPSATGRTPYDGYTSCPLITKQGKVILAEFNYKPEPTETFMFDQGKERRTMWWLKKYIMPFIYWQLLVKGRWYGNSIFRKFLNPFNRN